jgi:hypothetical protein
VGSAVGEVVINGDGATEGASEGGVVCKPVVIVAVVTVALVPVVDVALVCVAVAVVAVDVRDGGGG